MFTPLISRSNSAARILGCVAAATLALPAHAQVLRIGVQGFAQHATLAQALAAAQDGDSLVLSGRSYPGFTIDGRALKILEAPGQTVVVNGTVTIRNLARAQTVVLDGLDIVAPALADPGARALVVTDNAGCVRVQHCTVVGGEGRDGPTDDFACGPVSGGPAAYVRSSARVLFTRCALTGGWGSSPDDSFNCYGGPGGDALDAATSTLAFYDCTLVGGHGGPSNIYGGDHDYNQADYAGPGGVGARLASGRLFASGSSVRGGNGGDGAFERDRGGDGLVLGAPALARLRGTTLAGGLGGMVVPPFGPPGLPSSGTGALVTLPFDARAIDVQALSRDATNLSISVTGKAGDAFFLEAGERAGLIFGSGTQGAWTIAPPYPQLAQPTPFFVCPADGTFTTSVALPDLGATSFASASFLQARVVDGLGNPIEASPFHLLVLDHQALPDCNGNGALDLFDVLEHASPDVDNNLNPDSCDNDCNGNGVPDTTDIVNHTSFDSNSDGLPDECQTSFARYVDPAAPPGGNGSAAQPFQTISEGKQASAAGDTLILKDGLYVGAQNLGLDLGALTLRSENGSANCILDGQGVRRAFRVSTSASAVTILDGLTIQNGYAPAVTLQPGGGALALVSGNLILRNSRVRLCSSNQRGGALDVTATVFLCENCRFEDNTAPGRSGGALYVNHGSARFDGCTFLRNQAAFGGAIWSNQPFVVQRSRLLRNVATNVGGAIGSQLLTPSGDVIVESCLFAGNYAVQLAGALHCDGTSTALHGLRVLNSTLVANLVDPAGYAGGAIYADRVRLTLANTIAWANTAAAGAQIELADADLHADASDVEGGASGVGLLGTGTIVWGPLMLDVDPQFADADGPDDQPLTFNDNDYRLSLASPCVDAGDNALVRADLFDLDGDGNRLEPLPLDLEGLARFRDEPGVPDTGNGSAPIVDMGAFEF